LSFIRGFIGFILAVALAVFAIFNRHDVLLSVGPVYETVSLPLYLIVMVFMGVGFVFGGLFVWLGAAPVRKTKRRQRKEIRKLEKELEKLKGASVNMDAPADDFFPALPARKNSSI
jgi:putative membrane protein